MESIAAVAEKTDKGLGMSTEQAGVGGVAKDNTLVADNGDVKNSKDDIAIRDAIADPDQEIVAMVMVELIVAVETTEAGLKPVVDPKK